MSGPWMPWRDAYVRGLLRAIGPDEMPGSAFLLSGGVERQVRMLEMEGKAEGLVHYVVRDRVEAAGGRRVDREGVQMLAARRAGGAWEYSESRDDVDAVAARSIGIPIEEVARRRREYEAMKARALSARCGDEDAP